MDCGEPDPVVLHFDHVKGRKQKTVSQLLHCASWATAEEEIKKCDVRCANCHIRRHAKENGQLKYLWGIQHANEFAGKEVPRDVVNG